MIFNTLIVYPGKVNAHIYKYRPFFSNVRFLTKAFIKQEATKPFTNVTLPFEKKKFNAEIHVHHCKLSVLKNFLDF
jgi:hypothetical protein